MNEESPELVSDIDIFVIDTCKFVFDCGENLNFWKRPYSPSEICIIETLQVKVVGDDTC